MGGCFSRLSFLIYAIVHSFAHSLYKQIRMRMESPTVSRDIRNYAGEPD